MSSSVTPTEQQPPARMINTKVPHASTLPTSTSPRAMASAGEKGNPDVERKRKLIQSIPILNQAVKGQHCGEDDLIFALKITTFTDGEYVYCQGQTEREVYFIEEGKVLITQRRVGTGPARLGARRRSMLEAELEIQITAHEVHGYFGEMALLQNAPRKSNAVTSGAVTCMVLHADDFQSLLGSLHQLMLYRNLLRSHSVLEKHRLFKEFTHSQQKHMINHCSLSTFQNDDYICRQGDMDDRYFILAEGEANVVIDESLPDSTHSRSNSLFVGELGRQSSAIKSVKRGDGRGGQIRSSTVAHKSLFQGFGEMGLLDKPRTAHVLAKGNPVVCVVITRKDYIAASQLSNAVIDVDAESLLATTLIEEWNLVINARNLHLSNPQVSHYLITFIKKFKAAYNQKFVGKTMYLDFLRRLNQEPQLGDEFEFVSSRIAWDSPSSSLSIIRSETRRILSAPPSVRSPSEMSFVGRMIENTFFLNKFQMPSNVDKHKVARHLGRLMEFLNIGKDMYLFRQGKIESKAFMILRGKINIVNEDVNSLQTVKHYEVIATLSAGDSFGEMSLVTRLQRSATAMASCDTDLLVLDRDRLHMLMAALPGVQVRHEMVQRAELLSKLDFFRGCDFGQCIRVAHDMQEVVYEPHHLFLKEAVHLRTLYIVKSGEIAVFLKKIVPATTFPTLNMAASSSLPVSASATIPTKTVLIRVATIGPQEFFGVTIAFANISGAAVAPSNATVGGNSANASNPGIHASHSASGPTVLAVSSSSSSVATSQAELASTVFMCCTRVEILELSERGWRRLTPQSLQTIRSSLLERNRWNHELMDTLKDPSYYHLEKPWQLLARGNSVTGKLEDRQPTQLARRLNDKKQNATSGYALLFPNSGSASSERSIQPRSEAASTRKEDSPSKSQFTKTPPLSPRVSTFEWNGTPRLALGGSFAAGASFATESFVPHPPSPNSCMSRTTGATSPLVPCRPRPAPPSDFVRILSPILPQPKSHAGTGSSSRPGRNAKSSPGRTENEKNQGSIAFDSMWKLQHRPSLGDEIGVLRAWHMLAAMNEEDTESYSPNMAHSRQESDDVLILSGRHASTYWLFAHLEGLCHVRVPETALFDSEGVLEAWIFARANKNQDIANDRQSEIIAVKCMDELVLMSEFDLDQLIRTLCRREIAMNAAEPDIQIPRDFPGGGRFCLQEYVPPQDNALLSVHFQHLSARLREEDGESRIKTTTMSCDGEYSLSTRACRLSTKVGAENDYEVDDKVRSRVQKLICHVIKHFQVFFGIQLLDGTLEFTLEKQRGTIYLIGAQSISVCRSTSLVCTKLQSPAPQEVKNRDLHKSTRKSGNQNTSALSAANTAARSQREWIACEEVSFKEPIRVIYRVCRICRRSDDIDLAKELNQKQKTLRSTLAKYQHAQEQKAIIEKEHAESQSLQERQQVTIAKLRYEIDRVRSEVHSKGDKIVELAKENGKLEAQLCSAMDELKAARMEAQLAKERLLLATQERQAEAFDVEQVIRERMLQWESINAQLQSQLGQLQQELGRSQQTLRKLQTKYEEIRADRDEIRFQWRYVCRKLIGINEPGVALPQRIAGGYRMYPSPSADNVRDVVKWLVNYDAKKALIESQQKKSIAKHLKLKLELMRVLGGSPTKRKSSLSCGFSPSRRRSRSPSRSPSKSPCCVKQSDTDTDLNDAKIANDTEATANKRMTLVEEASLKTRAKVYAIQENKVAHTQ